MNENPYQSPMGDIPLPVEPDASIVATHGGGTWALRDWTIEFCAFIVILVATTALGVWFDIWMFERRTGEVEGPPIRWLVGWIVSDAALLGLPMGAMAAGTVFAIRKRLTPDHVYSNTGDNAFTIYCGGRRVGSVLCAASFRDARDAWVKAKGQANVVVTAEPPGV